jgi:two-component system chemotaxis response regulator CheY
MLDEPGFDSEEACDGSEAIALLRTAFDVLLVDWNMPNVDGVQFVQAVRNDPFHNKHIPLVMVTSVDEPT